MVTKKKRKTKNVIYTKNTRFLLSVKKYVLLIIEKPHQNNFE